tara:strand:+ start:566 stop:703 length:138 start_codon:yes stop_codon:yes gene_type:complete
MITKTADWSLVVAGLRELHRSKKFTDKVMKKIKELDLQNVESKNK